MIWLSFDLTIFSLSDSISYCNQRADLNKVSFRLKEVKMGQAGSFSVVVRRRNGGMSKPQTYRFVRIKAVGPRSLFTQEGEFAVHGTWWVTETLDDSLVPGAVVTFASVDNLFEVHLPDCRLEISPDIIKFEWRTSDCPEATFMGTIESIHRG